MIAHPVEQSAFPFLVGAAEGGRGARLDLPAAEPGPRVSRARRREGEERRARLRAGARPRPVHVPIRWHERVTSPLDPPWYDALDAAVRAGAAAVGHRDDAHVFHAAARAEGAVLVVQAQTDEALRAGLRAFSEAATRRANRALRRLGPVLVEEHLVQALPAAAEFSEALRRLLGVRGEGR